MCCIRWIVPIGCGTLRVYNTFRINCRPRFYLTGTNENPNPFYQSRRCMVVLPSEDVLATKSTDALGVSVHFSGNLTATYGKSPLIVRYIHWEEINYFKQIDAAVSTTEDAVRELLFKQSLHMAYIVCVEMGNAVFLAEKLSEFYEYVTPRQNVDADSQWSAQAIGRDDYTPEQLVSLLERAMPFRELCAALAL